MHKRTLFRIFLCLLVVATHTHCVLAHGAELLGEVEASRRAEPPIDNRQPCENESGCICKGAILCEAAVAVLSQDELTVWLVWHHVNAAAYFAPLSNGSLDYLPEPAPPPHGASARALLGSFQI